MRRKKEKELQSTESLQSSAQYEEKGRIHLKV